MLALEKALSLLRDIVHISEMPGYGAVEHFDRQGTDKDLEAKIEEIKAFLAEQLVCGCRIAHISTELKDALPDCPRCHGTGFISL